MTSRATRSPTPPRSAPWCRIPRQLSIGGSYVTLNGLQIENGFFGIHSTGSDNVVKDCRVTNCAGQGILGGSTITGNYVDAIGGEVVDNNGAVGRDGLEHDLYTEGSGLDITDNFFGRAASGSSAQVFCYNTTVNSLFSDNVCYGGQTSGATLEGGNIIATGNVFIAPQLYWRGVEVPQEYADPGNPAGGAPSGLRLFLPQPNVTVSGNYIEGAYSGLEIWGNANWGGGTAPPVLPAVPGMVITHNTIAGNSPTNADPDVYDLLCVSGGLPAVMNANQWGWTSN